VVDAEAFEKLRASRLLFGGCVLAALAAAVNIHFILRVGISVSHLTGDVSRLSAEFVTRPEISHEALRLLLSISSFVIGAMISGYVIHHPALTAARPYGRSAIAIGVMILVAWFMEPRLPTLAYSLTAGACGFQNALATRYRGIVIRTTHITGLLTDFGQLIGMKLAGHAVELWKPLLHALLAGSFVAGSILGAALDLFYTNYALLIIGATYVAVGVAWTTVKHVLPTRITGFDARV